MFSWRGAWLRTGAILPILSKQRTMLYPRRDMLLSTMILLDYQIIQMIRASEQVAKAADYSFHPDPL
jgi:hypothetical protein